MSRTGVRLGRSLTATDLVACSTRHASAVELRRRLHHETVAALTEAGFARHFVPRRWGGEAGGFAPLVAAAMAVGEACPATAWCATLFAAHGRLAAYLPEPAQRDIWGAGPNVLIAASVMPATGDATLVPGGWRLSGEWSRASGIDFAHWALIACRVRNPHAGETVRIFAVPAGDFQVKDTWRTIGMRGTGSNSITLDDVLIPAHRTVALGDLLDTRPTAEAPCHNVPYTLVAATLFAAPLVGAARGLLTDFMSTAGARLAADPGAQRTLARVASETRAAGLLVRESADRADHGMVDPKTVTENCCDAAVAAEICVRGADQLFSASGSRGLAEDDPVQRRWRDIRAAASHATLQLAKVADAYTRAVLT